MVDPVQVFTDLVRYETRLYNVLDQRIRAEHGLTVGQLELLRFIDGHENCRVNDLAHEVAITIGATSKAVDRLEAAGWVSRRPNPANRRSSLLALTDDGQRILADATPTLRDELVKWLGDPAAARLAAQLAQLRMAMEEAKAGMPTG